HFNELKMLVDGWMRRNRSFMVHYRMLHNSMMGQRGLASARFEIESTPADPEFPPDRRNVVVNIDAERGKDGWRLVSLQPEDFFPEQPPPPRDQTHPLPPNPYVRVANKGLREKSVRRSVDLKDLEAKSVKQRS